MTLIATRNVKQGDVIKHEYEPSTGYCRELRSVTVTATTAIGTVLNGAAAVLVAGTASANGVVVDPKVYEYRKVPGTYTLAVLKAGPSIIGDANLTYGADVDTKAEKDAVNAALTANTGIKVAVQV